MQEWGAQYLVLTTFPTSLTAAEIDALFTLNGEIAPVVGARRTPLTRLGLVLQIGFLRLTGRSLNSVQMIPPAVLQRAGQAAGIAAPRLASIRSIYRCRMTLYQHQQAAMVAGVSDDQIEHVMRQIVASGRLRAASDAVVHHMLSHPVSFACHPGLEAPVSVQA